MALSKALDGFRPSRQKGSATNSSGVSEYSIASGYAANIFNGDVVTINVGKVEVVTTVGLGNDIPLGVFAGCTYTQNGAPVFAKYWPASTSASDIVAFVNDDQNTTFIAQADAAVTVGDVYSTTFNVTLGTGSTYTGQSGHGIAAATRGDDGMLTVLGAFKEPGNALGDTNPRVEIIWKQHVNAYPTVGISAG
jgi:hypothetical protein